MKLFLLLLHIWIFDGMDMCSMFFIESLMILTFSIYFNFYNKLEDGECIRNFIMSRRIFIIFTNIIILYIIRMEIMEYNISVSMIYELLNMFLAFIFSNVWFYISHRLFHCKFLYKEYHYMHHIFHAKNPLGAFYAHPFEFLCCNVPAMISPFFFGCSVPLVQAYCFVSFCNIIVSHSDVNFGLFQKSMFHQKHHRTYSKNFGLNTEVLDKLMGTYG